MKTAGPAWAKSQMTTLEGGLFALKSLNCQTDVCFNYKQTLEARAYENLDKLHTLVNTYEPYIAGIAGGVAGGVRPRQPTLREGETAGAQAGKSEAYWSKVKAETGGAKGAGTLANAERGTLTEANFAQNKIKSDRSFSEDGQKVYSELAGTPIRTVDDLAGALRAGTIKPNQLPVDYVDMNGGRLMLNTRTSTALEQTAIPRSEWFGRNQTGVEAYPGKTFNDLAAEQLKSVRP